MEPFPSRLTYNGRKIMRGTLAIGTVLASTILVAFALAPQEKKMDPRANVGTMPGGVTLFGSEKVTPLRDGLEIATFGGG